MKPSLFPLLLFAAGAAFAETPHQIADAYAAEAARAAPGFAPSAARGADFYARKFAISERMPACAACHTENPAQPGRHAVTGKDIKPLAPRAEASRLSDPAKVEKWFRRNCTEVVGRACTPAEKADFVVFLAEGR